MKNFKLNILNKEYNVKELSLGRKTELLQKYQDIYKKQLNAEDNSRLVAKTNKMIADIAITLIPANTFISKIKKLFITKNRIYYGMSESEYLIMITQVVEILGLATNEEKKK